MRETVLLLLALAGLPAGCGDPPGRDDGPTPLRPVAGADGQRGPYQPAPSPGSAAGALIDAGEPRPLGAIDPSVRRESPKIEAPTTAPARQQLADGDQILRQVGQVRVEKGTARRLFVFNPPAEGRQALPTMEILPGVMLEAIERAVTEAGDAEVLFHITGEVTRYHGRWYLLIRKALVERKADSPAERTSGTQP